MPTITEREFRALVELAREAYEMDHRDAMLLFQLTTSEMDNYDSHWTLHNVELWESGRLSYVGTGKFYTAKEAEQMIEDMRKAKVIDW